MELCLRKSLHLKVRTGKKESKVFVWKIYRLRYENFENLSKLAK